MGKAWGEMTEENGMGWCERGRLLREQGEMRRTGAGGRGGEQQNSGSYGGQEFEMQSD